MKPAAFDYTRPGSLDEACAMLAETDDARIIAGGQTLVPLMAMRLARPKRLIDIARIAELGFVRKAAGIVTIGATTRQSMVEHDPIVRADLPLLAKAMPFVGHAPIRSRGTIGGSLANADPAAEIALVAVTLGATLIYREGARSIEVTASQFFLGPMLTSLPATGCLVAVRFPIWTESRVGVGFQEINARTSDFAFASAAAQLALDENGICRRLVVGVGAITSSPLRLDDVAEALIGTRLDDASIRAALHEALADVPALADLHASAEYRRRAAATLAFRALAEAYAAATAEVAHAR
jgi:CO/xanthine dehydrogenase FAD-binding subunit